MIRSDALSNFEVTNATRWWLVDATAWIPKPCVMHSPMPLVYIITVIRLTRRLPVLLDSTD
ncbi:MAG: hypothetical protein JW863_06545 [Chitinispirillaceae bacterium]|nr:hypothetical protein [Chitinispirillaceae bacterium]